MRHFAGLAVLAVSAAVSASTVREEAGISSVRPTTANPSSGSFTDSVSATIEINHDWSLDLGGTATLQGKTPALQRGQFPESGSAVTLFNAGAEYNATDSLALIAGLQLSPRSVQYAGTTMALRQASGAEVSADELVRSQTSQAGGTLGISWDSIGESTLEWSYAASLDYSHANVDQTIPRVRLADGTTLATTTLRQETLAYCSAHPALRNCGQGLLTALRATPVTLDSERLSASATATLFGDTDVTLGGDYYLYEQDPGQIGFFALAATGRTAGVPIAPLRFQVRPEVVQRVGDFSAKVWVQAGRYMPGMGGTTESAGLKLQYKFTRAFRSWIVVAAQRDVDQGDEITRTNMFSAGAAYGW